MITKRIPKESFLGRIKYDPTVYEHYKSIVEGIRKQGVSDFKTELLDRVEEITEARRHTRLLGLISPIKEELYSKRPELLQKNVDELTVYVGESECSLLDLSNFYEQLVPTELFILLNYYLKGAEEISISQDLVESLSSIPVDKTPYENCNLSPMTWVNLSHLNVQINTVIPAIVGDTEMLELTSGVKVSKHKSSVSGILIVDLSRNKGREWESMKDFSEKVTDNREGLLVFIITKFGLRDMFGGRLIASDLEDLKEKVELIQLGYGDLLGLEFEMGIDRKYGLSPSFDKEFNLDMAPMGDVIDIAIKSILYAQDPVVKSKTVSFRGDRGLNVKKPKKKKLQRKLSSSDYYRVIYINKGETSPVWTNHRPSVEKADSRFYSSHYRRIWVVKEYLEKHSVPDSHILDYDESKGRRNKFGELIYKERYRIAIKVNGTTDPILTVKKYT